MTTKLKVDQNKCIGCGTCTAIAPQTFQLGKNGKAQVVNEKGDSVVKIKEAIASCPVSAISFQKAGA